MLKLMFSKKVEDLYRLVFRARDNKPAIRSHRQGLHEPIMSILEMVDFLFGLEIEDFDWFIPRARDDKPIIWSQSYCVHIGF